MDFKVRKVIRDIKGHYIMIVGSILQEDITVFNVYEPNRASEDMRQKLRADSIILIDDFNALHRNGQTQPAENQ